MKLLIFFLFLSLNLSAQNANIEKLLKNKDITWVAEVTDTSFLENELNEALSFGKTITLKILNDDKKTIAPDNGNNLIDILNQVPWENLELYKDPELKKRIDKRESLFNNNPDTITFIDPITLEKKIGVNVCLAHWFQEVIAYKFRYILYFNAYSAKFDFYPISIAPLFTIYSDSLHVPNTEFLKKKFQSVNSEGGEAFKILMDSVLNTLSSLTPLRYIKLKYEKKLPSLASNDIIWAMRIRNRRGGVSETNFKILKSTNGSVIKQVLEKVNTNKKIPIMSTDSLTLIDTKSRYELFNRTDTIQVLDPNTNERKIKVVTAGLNYDGCKNLRLIYDWFWDRKKNQLIVKLLGVAPMCDVNDATGNFMYLKTMFYLPAPGR